MDPAALGGMLDGFWDMPLVAGIAFHPSRVDAQYMNEASGPVRDGLVPVTGGDQMSYRLYMPTGAARFVVYFFHGNAMLCTDVDDFADEVFHKVNAAVLSFSFRGYAWSTGTPSLTKLVGDADDCLAASEDVLAAAGLGEAKRIAMGRSIGATCAVHLASAHPDKFHGLIVDSGLMSIKLPLVVQMAPQVFGPNANMMMQMLPEPFDTIGKLPALVCPTVVMHGEQDNIVPFQQGVLCHDKCGSAQKKIRSFKDAGHNDVTMLYYREWAAEIHALLEQAEAYTPAPNPFPPGATVETHSLSTTAMNGMVGQVEGRKGDRVLVRFPDPVNQKALKPVNLKVIGSEGPAAAEP